MINTRTFLYQTNPTSTFLSPKEKVCAYVMSPAVTSKQTFIMYALCVNHGLRRAQTAYGKESQND